MISFIVLAVIVAWAFTTGLKRHEGGRRFSRWRVWFASVLGLSLCYFAANVDSLGVPLSWLAPLREDHLGFLTLSLCALAMFFCVQLIVNHVLLRDGRGIPLHGTVNARLCLRALLSLLSIPTALLFLHAGALFLISAA